VNELPDLSRLSESDKDDLIRELWLQVLEVSGLKKVVSSLQARVEELQGQLAKNSQNSSKPPSSDGLNKPAPKSLRQAGQRPTGGQKGHPGRTLKKVAQPDKTVQHEPPPQCDTCGRALSEHEVVESRQVFDLPPLRYEVTEHQVLQAQCACGKVHRGEFPEGVWAPVQYGPHALAAMVHMSQHHMLPAKRTSELMGDFFGLAVSDATVLSAVQQAAERLQPTVQAIGQALIKAAITHADETGLRVNKTLHWMHVLASANLTWLGLHAKRGKEAFHALGLLALFRGTLIHDGWAAYRALTCKHGLCNAHHLRELTYVNEQLKQGWARKMIELLVAASREVALAAQPLDRKRQAYYRRAYRAILTQGETLNPRQPPSGRRGRTKQSKAANLLARLRTQAADVWRFMTDTDVPFTNNIAEQAVRMPKVKQKVSGCFRSVKGAEAFCSIRSYASTMHKQGANIFHCLALVFQGNTPQPRLI
jgi:transposase